MKEQQLDALEQWISNTRKIKNTNGKGSKYKGNHYLKFRKVKTEPSKKIQLLQTSITPADLSAIIKTTRFYTHINRSNDNLTLKISFMSIFNQIVKSN